MGLITREGLNNIDNYKYYPPKPTYLDKKLLPIYKYILNFVPMVYLLVIFLLQWVSGNLISLSGICILVINWGMIVLNGTQFAQNTSPWRYIFGGFTLIVYAILNDLSSLQAMKTNHINALRIILKRCCDAVAIMFVVTSVAEMLKIGPSILTLTFISIIQLGFFVACWEEYHTQVMTISQWGIGATEIQLVLGIMHFITGIYGERIWERTIPTPDYLFDMTESMRYHINFAFDFQGINIIILLITPTTLLLLYKISAMIYKGLGSSLEKGLSFSYLFPVYFNFINNLFWYHTLVYYSHPILVVFTACLATIYITIKLIIASAAKVSINFLLIYIDGIFILPMDELYLFPLPNISII